MVMSDFLKNLRSSHKKEPQPHRKPMEGNFYPQTERRMISDRRTPPMHRQSSQPLEDLARDLEDIMPVIMDNTTTLAQQVEKLASISEMIAESQIRKNNAVADFFEDMKDFMANTPQPEMGMPPRATTSYASGTHYTKDEILSIINNMRDQGSTFAIIADYLKEKGIPTFSGRGEWHAQTIHRLCK